MAWMAAYLIYVGLYGVDGCIPYICRAVWRGWLCSLYNCIAKNISFIIDALINQDFLLHSLL